MESLQRLFRESWNDNGTILPNLVLLGDDDNTTSSVRNGARRAVWNLNCLFGVPGVKLYRTARVVCDTQLTRDAAGENNGNRRQ